MRDFIKIKLQASTHSYNSNRLYTRAKRKTKY